jgi:hypothetical protein
MSTHVAILVEQPTIRNQSDRALLLTKARCCSRAAAEQKRAYM